MTTPLIIEDLNGEQYAVQTLVQEHEVLNNEKEIEFLLMENEETADFIEDLQTGYKAHFRGNEYWIYNPVYELDGDKVFIQCKAIHYFFKYFNGFYTQETWKDQSMTPADSILPLFHGKKFTVNLLSSLYAAVMNSERNITYTERIQYAINRHDAEREIDGTDINIKSRLGSYRDDIILHPDINIAEVKKEVESESLATWAKGFWGKVKDEEGNETEEYEHSTTAQHDFLVSIYGTEAMEGKAIYNDSIKHEATMKETIFNSLDETFILKFTMSIKEYDDPEKFKTIQIGDTLNAVIDKLDADIDLRVLEISRDWLNDEIQDMEITIGNGGAKAEYSSPDMEIIMEDVAKGKRSLPPSAYDEGVRRATALINGDLNGNFQYMPDGVYGQDPSNPNHRTRYSIAGIAYMTDGRNWNEALTFRGLTASAIYTGTLRTDLVDIRGADGHFLITGDMLRAVSADDLEQYSIIEDGHIEARGKHERTWRGETDTHDVSLRFENGYIRARNNSLNRSLYFSDYGISTYADAEGNDDASGSLLFRDPMYSNAAGGGLTVHSTYGSVAMRSDYSRAFIDAEDTVNIESRLYSVYLRPYRESRPGTNEFQFYVKDNPSGWDTDGALLFGSITEGAGAGSGIRFKKDGREDPTVYATNLNGDIGTGDFHGKAVRTGSVRVIDEGANLYLGTSTGEVRVTNNLLYNGGNIGYKPIKASAFNQASSKTYKTNIEDVGNVGLETIKSLNVVEYDLIDDIEEGITDNRQIGLIAEDSAPVATKDLTGIDLYKMSSYSIKAIQELEKRVKELEAK